MSPRRPTHLAHSFPAAGPESSAAAAGAVGAAQDDADPVVDGTALRALTARLGDRAADVLGQLFSTWDTETAARLERLAEAVAAGDRDAVARVAHAIKGGSASLGAVRLATTCGEVEDAVHAGTALDLAAVQQRLVLEVHRSRSALGALCLRNARPRDAAR